MNNSSDKTLRLSYVPREWARVFHASAKRWMVLVVHRRAGKTTAALNFMQVSALRNPNRRYAYIAPTYKQAKNIAWSTLKQYSRDIPNAEHRETELSVKYPNGSMITLFGADNPDSLRGMGLAGVVFDEYSQQPSNIFTEIVRPMLTDHAGSYAIWIGTPKGKNEFYRMYERARTDPAWLALKLTVDDTNAIDPKEIGDARLTMSNDEFLQELYCSFDASLKGSIYGTELARLRSEGRIKQVPYDAGQLVHTVWDLGVGASLAVGFFQKVKNEIRLIDYWQGIASEGLTDAIRAVKTKPYTFGKHFAPHDIKAREITSGLTRFDTAANLGVRFEVIKSTPLADGIERTKIFFSRLWVDEQHCELWLDAVSQYRREWDDAKGMFRDQPLHNWTSHAADVVRYAAVADEQMIAEDWRAERMRKAKEYVQPPYQSSNLFDGEY